jgi:hypothetical protein
MNKTSRFNSALLVGVVALMSSTVSPAIVIDLGQWINYGEAPTNRSCNATENFNNLNIVYIQRCIATTKDPANNKLREGAQIYTFIYNSTNSYMWIPVYNYFEVYSADFGGSKPTWHWIGPYTAYEDKHIFAPHEKKVFKGGVFFDGDLQGTDPLHYKAIGYSWSHISAWDGQWNNLGDSFGYTPWQ